MSLDLDLYEDEHVGISATLGGWGVRLSVDQKKRDPKYPDASGLMGDLLTREKLEALIAGLGRVKEHMDLLAEDEDWALRGVTPTVDGDGPSLRPKPRGSTMFFDLWVKQTVFLAPAGGGPVDPGYGQPGPPGFWPGTPPPRPGPPLFPSHPIYNPVDPGFGQPGPPGFWPGTPPDRPGPPLYPSHPIYNPVDPGFGQPSPPLGFWGPGSGFPTHPIAPGGPPPGIWPGPGYPAHPIAPGGPPPQVWPGPGYPAHPIAPGGPPPQVWPGPGYPAHPIAPGGPPPQVWPGPGYPAHPIAPGGPPPGIWPGPGYPAHPIAPGGPPPGIWPSPGYPAHPIAPGGPPPFPEHPIYYPSTVYPLPETIQPPTGEPTTPPDLASPGYPSYLMTPGKPAEACWVQTGFVTEPGHEPKPPEKGLPGTWVGVYAGEQGVACYAWLPSPEPEVTPHDAGAEGKSERKSKHSS